MSRVERLLHQVPGVYADLEAALLPHRGGDGTGRAGTRVDAPMPVDPEVAEHRHLLVRGLRWWVDAVDDGTCPLPVGDSVARMCVWLLVNLRHMAAEDLAKLDENLGDWLHTAMGMVGAPERVARRLPAEALDARVPVHVAAEALGVSVRTVQRRTSSDAGTVLLRDAAGPLCPRSDLPSPWCDHCVGA